MYLILAKKIKEYVGILAGMVNLYLVLVFSMDRKGQSCFSSNCNLGYLSVLFTANISFGIPFFFLINDK